MSGEGRDRQLLDDIKPWLGNESLQLKKMEADRNSPSRCTREWSSPVAALEQDGRPMS